MKDPHQIAADIVDYAKAAIEKALNNQGDDYANMDAARNRILDLERDLAACRRAAHASDQWIGCIGGLISCAGKPIGNALNIDAAKQIADAHNAAMKSRPAHASEP